MKLDKFHSEFQTYVDLYALKIPTESNTFGVFQANGDVEYTYLVKDAYGTVIGCLRAATSHRSLHDKAEFTTLTWDDLGYVLSQKTNNTYDNPAQALADVARLASLFTATPTERTKFIPAALKLYQHVTDASTYDLEDCLTIMVFAQGDYNFATQLTEQQVPINEILTNSDQLVSQLKALYNYAN